MMYRVYTVHKTGYCSLHEFVSRRLGPELADFAVSSLVRGICAGDSKSGSVHFIASYLHQLEQETGRISLGVARLISANQRPTDHDQSESC